jgi:proline iminopeptidase
MESFRTSDGRTIAYNVMGSGPVLVCHPGGPGFAGAELADLGGLTAMHQLVVVSPRGSGDSDPAPDYELDGYAADLEELRTHLGLEKMDLLGFSYGAVVAIHYAARYPERLGRLVLAGGLAAFTPEGEEFAKATIASKAGEPWHADAVAALEAEERGEIEDMAALWVREAPLYFAKWDERYRPAVVAGAVGIRAEPLLYSNRVGFDVRAELSNVTAPTLIVCGREDFVCGPPAAQELASGIAGSRVVMLDETGHMMFIEQPEAFRDAIASFLAEA